MNRVVKWAALGVVAGVAAIGGLLSTANQASASTTPTVNRVGNQVTVEWVDVADAVSYTVTPNVNGVDQTPVEVAVSEYIATNVLPNTTYIYKVSATTTTDTQDLFLTTPVRYGLAKLSVTSKLSAHNAVTLKYSSIYGANKYEIYRSTKPTSGFKRIATVVGTSYTNKGLALNTTYYYKVRGVQTTSQGTYYTGWSATTSKRPFLGKTKAKVSAVSYSAVKISYNKVEGASGYKIYRSTKATKGFKRIATVKGTSYTSKKLKTGTRYYYKVVPYKGKVNAGVSNRVSAKPYLKKPSFKSANMALGTVKIGWTKVSGASGYKVYRATSKNGKYTLVKTTRATSFTDKKLKNNKTYYYTVKAYRTVGKKQVSSGKTTKLKLVTPRKPTQLRAPSNKFYVLEGDGYYSICKGTKCNWSTDDTNHIFERRAYVYVPKGWYLTFSGWTKGARITDAQYYYTSQKSSLSKPGHYLVGADLKPGVYRLSSSKSYSYTICGWMHCDWSEGDDIENVWGGGVRYITLYAGDFLDISTYGGTIKGVRQ